MRKQDRKRTPNSYKFNYFYSKYPLRLLLSLCLIALASLYWNQFKINIYNPARLDNNITYITQSTAFTVTDNAVRVNNWYARYNKLQSTITKESKIAQTSIGDNSFILLSVSCQRLNNSLLAAKDAPIIPIQAAQEDWSKAQVYYLSAIKLCSFPRFIFSQSSSHLIINDLKHGDQLLLNSINYILDCC